MADHIRTNPHQAYVAVRNALWPALHRLGFDGGDVLIQGGGAPTLLKMPGAPEIPEDFLAAHLARLDRLDPDAQHQPAPRGGEGDYDLVIASLPWADVQLRDPARWSTRLHRHLLMTIAATRLARPGGLVAVMTTHDLMDTPNPAPRRAILSNATFLGAVRLPAGALRPQAGTDNVVDLILLKTRTPGPHETSRPFEATVTVNIGAQPVTLNQHFDDHPDHLLGSIDVEARVWGPPVMTVAGDLTHLAQDLRTALAKLTDDAARDGLADPPGARPATRPDVRGGWVIDSARRYLPALFDVDAYRGRTPAPEHWLRPSLDPPAIDL
ncbi:hypothetical protein [Xylanimonas protaetiae]|uniref:Uncharacterized protein n=1 Tax=Xylanimonas protaetiae TaxID=2509457 RepID=A0A4P6EZC0_9MICO|nr:hypothetical protein [Xylanimonas protaetiae]QAY68800.1 hypothetical protein ET471_01010 [Xylanimonas protaetiae]